MLLDSSLNVRNEDFWVANAKHSLAVVKHGSYYVRVHPCRLQLIHSSVEGTRSAPNQFFDEKSLPQNPNFPPPIPGVIGGDCQSRWERGVNIGSLPIEKSEPICTLVRKGIQGSNSPRPVSNLETFYGSDTLAEEGDGTLEGNLQENQRKNPTTTIAEN